VSLLDLLASLPPRLQLLTARQLSFHDYDSIPSRPFATARDSDTPRVRVFLSNEGVDTRLMIWRDVEEGKWYRRVKKVKVSRTVDET
jgi:hypothetical protein